MRVETQHHAALAAVSSYSPAFRAFFVCLATLLASAGLHDILYTAFVAVGSFVPALQFVFLLLSWAHVFKIYRERVYAMRRGLYFFDRGLYREEEANKYVGFQVAPQPSPRPPPHASPF